MKIEEDKLIRISDILEQIQNTEQIIFQYKNLNGLETQLSQYDDIREKLVKELSELMQAFHFEIKYQKEAA
jgi:hypothetical protein